MKLIFLFFFTNLIAIIFNTTLVLADDRGITFKAQIETNKGDIIEFKGCSSEQRNNKLTSDDPNNSNWGEILKKSQISDEDRENNWVLYREFFDNCEEYEFKTAAGRIVKGVQDLKKCATSNSEYYIPKDISTWRDFCKASETNINFKVREDNNIESEKEVIPEKITIPNRFADKEIYEVYEIFNERFSKIEKFKNGDFQKLNARKNNVDNKFSDETLLQKKADIKEAIRDYKEAFLDTLHAVDRINNIICSKNQCSIKKEISR